MQMDQPIGSPHLAKNPKKRAFWETERVWKPLGPAGRQFRDSLSGRFCFLKSIKYIVPTLFCNPPRHRSLERFPPDGQAGLRDRLSSIRSEQPASSTSGRSARRVSISGSLPSVRNNPPLPIIRFLGFYFGPILRPGPPPGPAVRSVWSSQNLRTPTWPTTRPFRVSPIGEAQSRSWAAGSYSAP
jgi:hypothetical protein